MNKKQTKQEDVSVVPEKEANLIWEEVSKLKIDVYALPVEQTVSDYFNLSSKMLLVDSSKAYLEFKNNRATAAVSALETTLAKKFITESVDNFIVVKRV